MLLLRPAASVNKAIPRVSSSSLSSDNADNSATTCLEESKAVVEMKNLISRFQRNPVPRENFPNDDESDDLNGCNTENVGEEERRTLQQKTPAINRLRRLVS